MKTPPLVIGNKMGQLIHGYSGDADLIDVFSQIVLGVLPAIFTNIDGNPVAPDNFS